MNNLMPPIATATDMQRNYKQVAKRAKRLKQPIVIMANNKPQGVYIDYDTYQSESLTGIVSDKGGQAYSPRRRRTLEELAGSWTDEQTEEFNKIIEDAFEQINYDEWK